MGLKNRLSQRASTAVRNVSQTLNKGEDLVEDEMSKMGQLAQEIQEEEKHEKHLVHLREETLQLIQEVSSDFKEIKRDEEEIDTYNHQVMKNAMPANTWFNQVKADMQEIHQDIQEIENDMRKIHEDVVQAGKEEQEAAKRDEKIIRLEETIEDEFSTFEKMQNQTEEIFENINEEQGIGADGVSPKSKEELQR